MALVTVQRSPSPSTDPDSEAVEGEEGGSSRSPLRNRSLSESYFTVRGAALILPQGERPRRSTKKSHGGDIQHHLQSMLYLLRHEDRIKVAVKLESSSKEGHQRYMALVSTVGRQDTEESVILGIDYINNISSVGLVLPIYHGSQIQLDGDGGFCVRVSADDRKYLFKPVSVQAMWSALQSLQKAVKVAEDETYIPNGLTHTWVQYYTSQIDNSQAELVTMWNVMEGVEVSLSRMITTVKEKDDEFEVKTQITNRLTEAMMKVDLDHATSRSLREAVEEKLHISIKSYREYFDAEMMRIFGQMDSPSQILDFLYLGTEWNASNIDELTDNGVKYILNVTLEIDNFFPSQMKYMNIRLIDVDESQLLPYWDKTYRFISKARKNNSKILVHCKRGISRSASTVIAYLMKENQWSLDDAYDFVKERRNVIWPNDGFLEQLKCYEGILNASNQRHIFKSQSTENILEKSRDDEDQMSGGFLDDGDLYHQMFDSPYPHPASEEEVLQSLGRGRGLEDSDMHRIGTDFETGSRSTDSLEESLPDIPSPTPDQQEFISRKKISTKGEYYFATQYDNGSTSGEVAGLEMIHTEYSSDVEDEASVLYPRGQRSQNSSPVTSITDSCMRVSEGIDIQQASSQSRLRPDNSWIKLEMDTDEAAAIAEQPPPSASSPPVFIIGEDFTMPIPTGDRKSPVLTLDKPPESKSSRIRSASLGDRKQEESATEEKDLNKLSIRNRTASLGNRKVQDDGSCEESAGGTMDQARVESMDGQQLLARSDHLGITQYYTSEQIPWCPGTVQKMTSDFTKIQQGSDDESDSSQKETLLDAAAGKEVTDKQNPAEPESDMTETDSLSQTADSSLRMTQSCIELVVHDDSVTPDMTVRPKSVYEAEEIEYAEGFVRKFKNMLEGNGNSESRPIQRSASLKEDRDTTRTKRSARRKTCSAILSPSTPVQEDVPPKAEEDTTEMMLEGDLHSEGEITDGADKNFTVIKYGREEVPLEKGLVKKHKQDIESRSDLDARKRLSSESSLSSQVVDIQETTATTKDEQQKDSCVTDTNSDENLSATPPCEPIPSIATCDTGEYSTAVISERLIGTVREQKSILELKETQEPEHVPISRNTKKTKKDECSPVDPKTLAKMREFGSELLNQPKEEEESIQDLTLVKQAVRSIEKDTKVKKSERKIIIIEEGGKEKAKTQCQPLSEKSRSFDDSKSLGVKRTQQWVRDGGASSLDSLEAEKAPANRAGLCLNLSEHEEEADQSGSPRSDSELSIVRHLVGRFEKDIKSPVSEAGETSSNRSSFSMEFGLCFTEMRKKREHTDVEMRPKPSTAESNITRPLRPKSADHISRDRHNQPATSEKHIELKKSEQSEDVRKVRRLHGQPKPVIQRLGASPFYNTM